MSGGRSKQNYRDLIGAEYVEYDPNAWFRAATDFTVTSTTGADTAPWAAPTSGRIITRRETGFSSRKRSMHTGHMF